MVDEADVKAGNVAIVAPDGFMEEAIKENVIAGTPMERRAMFQFGALLPKTRAARSMRAWARSLARHRHADPADGDHPPAGQTQTVDGVSSTFQITPEPRRRRR